MRAGEPRPEEEGGDPPCWLDRVCPACGALNEDTDACRSCGAELHSPSSGP